MKSIEDALGKLLKSLENFAFGYECTLSLDQLHIFSISYADLETLQTAGYIKDLTNELIPHYSSFRLTEKGRDYIKLKKIL
jgi:hypothetical protein